MTTKVKKSFIPYGRQSISKQEEKEVLQVLRSNWITQGPTIQKFEECVAKYTGAKYAVAVSSGTAALHIALLSLNLKPKDEVITTPISFLASSNAILYAGAKPVFADINSKTFCLDPAEVEKKITKRTKAILTVDMTGHPSHLKELQKIAKKHKLVLIEDGSHALGAVYHTKRVGGIADLTTFSFHPVKTITTGEGGMVCTNRQDFYKKLLSLRNHGIIRFENKDPWYYEMQSLGFNYRITDIQCAMGLVQMKKLPSFLKRRRQIVKIYQRKLFNMPSLVVPKEERGSQSAWHLFVIRIDFKRIKKSRAQLFNEFRKQGIGLQVHYIPIYRQPYYRERGWGTQKLVESERYYDQCVSLPLYPSMTSRDIDRVVRAVRKFITV